MQYVAPGVHESDLVSNFGGSLRNIINGIRYEEIDWIRLSVLAAGQMDIFPQQSGTIRVRLPLFALLCGYELQRSSTASLGPNNVSS